MGTTADMIGRFPIDQLLFIVSAGLLLVLSFPFDIYEPIGNGSLQIPAYLETNSSTVCDCVNRSIYDLKAYVRGNFTPFFSVRYLNDFPNGFIKILILSLPVGTFVFLLYDAFEKLNHLIRHPLKNWGEFRAWLGKKKKKERDLKAPKKDKEKARHDVGFSSWVNDEGHRKYVDFLFSMKSMTTGLLFASETLLAIVIVSAILADPLAQSYPFRITAWLVLVLLMGLSSYGIFKLYDRRHRRKYQDLQDTFDAVTSTEDAQGAMVLRPKATCNQDSNPARS